MGSPMKSWDGVTAYFTGADFPEALWSILVRMLLAAGFVIFNAMRHEKRIPRMRDDRGYE